MNTADGVLAIDRQQRIVRWNDAAERLLGFKAEEMLGRQCHEVMAGRDESGRLVCDEKCSELMRGLRQELVPTHDLCIRAEGCREIWVSVSTVLVPSRRKDACFLTWPCL
jgi:PAS domain S-box-containing protein